MSRPTENEDQEIREGTEALKDIAKDVEAEREKSSGKTSLPSDEAEEAAGPDLEGRQDAEDVAPEDEGVVPVNPAVRPTI